jgi:predicted transcriptional regulator
VHEEGDRRRLARQKAATATGGLVMNHAAAEVGRFFRRHPGEEFDDYDVYRGTGLMPSVIYSALQSFVAAGWIEERWQDGDGPGEPRRVYYRLTEGGGSGLGSAVAEHHEKVRRTAPAESPTGRPAGPRRPATEGPA